MHSCMYILMTIKLLLLLLLLLLQYCRLRFRAKNMSVLIHLLKIKCSKSSGIWYMVYIHIMTIWEWRLNICRHFFVHCVLNLFLEFSPPSAGGFRPNGSQPYSLRHKKIALCKLFFKSHYSFIFFRQQQNRKVTFSKTYSSGWTPRSEKSLFLKIFIGLDSSIRD